jgi:uracil-DNA glycosylase family 4
MTAQDFRQAIVQFLATDRYFGQRALPIPRAAMTTAAAQSRGAATAAAPDAATDQGERLDLLDREQVQGCRKCRLCEGRNNTVFGTGNPNARLVFVGEGPGFEEDRQGIPFVGRAGQLLTKMILAMGLRREDVYICNIVKCRPPNNRDPAADEIMACSPYLYEQLRVIDPEVIVALGAPAAKTLLDSTLGIGRLRGQFHDFPLRDPSGEVATIPLMPTYHPAYLLRSPEQKLKAWQDLQQVMRKLGLPVPGNR